jgi:hypothetical protein
MALTAIAGASRTTDPMRRFSQSRPASKPAPSRKDALDRDRDAAAAGDPRRFHEVNNNLAAIRLWLTMLQGSSCPGCRRVQANGLSAILRNVEQAQALIEERFPPPDLGAPRAPRRQRKPAS